MRAIATRFYRHVSDEDLAGIPVPQLVAQVQAMLDLGSRRSADQALVELSDPADLSASLVRVITDDMPFLVDSVSMALSAEGRAIQLVIHPQLVVRRDAAGQLLEVCDLDVDEPRPAGAIAESWMLIELERDLTGPAPGQTLDRLRRVLLDVRAAVTDWGPMNARAEVLAAELSAVPNGLATADAHEAAALLRWLVDEHFTFLGYREYDLVDVDGEPGLQAVPGSGLGLLRETGDGATSRSVLPPNVRERATERTPLVLTKANSRSTVHRPAYLDYVGVKRLDADGNVVGERRFLGLLTASAYQASVLDVPVLRSRFATVLEDAGFAPGSHSAKDLQQFVESYPRDELFQLDADELASIAIPALHVMDRRQTKVFIRPDAYGRFMSCLVLLPRDRYTTPVRERIQQLLLDAFGGTATDYTARVDDDLLAKLHVTVHLPDPRVTPHVDREVLEAELARATRSWGDDLQSILIEQVGEAATRRLLRTYANAFPEAFKEDYPPAAGADATLVLDELADGELALDLYSPERYGLAPTSARERRFTIVQSGAPLSLSRVLPILQAMGVEVVDERPYEIVRSRGSVAWILDFGLLLPEGPDGVLPSEDSLTERFTDTFLAAWTRQTDVDRLCSMVVLGGLTWGQVMVLRSYVRYLRQIGSPYGQDYVMDAVTARTDIAVLLVALFEAQFDPAFDGDRDAEQQRLELAVEHALGTVPSLDHDRIIRSVLALVRASLRTNHFIDASSAGERGRSEALSIKLDPAGISDLPLPRPHREIWVHGPRVEGVHLRFGPVARGGLRWSDRREDFRTEVLGLVKAQAVKNAVIVPVGAKGGFVPQHLPDPSVDRDGWLAEGVASYRAFISAMLDITDNLVEGVVVPPAQVVRRDGDDSYLVVAADKGTATFSDIANGIAAEYGFWLGDAFASGGSVGYDHKAMGITARGAWESVKHHFRELGHDTQTQDFTVVGVGDMSGDVFGNGMLLSEHIRLIAAFDHRHVFIDPTPDATISFAERRRLFDLPRSSWADYDRALISAGGGVFERSAKSIALTPQIRQALAIDDAVEALTPAALIRAILCAPVDLLWNGGIGTYVKARIETNADAGDKSNDAVRVNGDELRCRVVGEGGNLGFTQRGRIEAAQIGVRLNTDAIDNSAGVDTSDHEVNLKILLDLLVRDGVLDEVGRNALLAQVEPDVAQAVLADNFAQNIVLGVARSSASELVTVHARFMTALERDGVLDRALEGLPGDVELGVRAEAGGGLTSPELSVLLAYAKMTLEEALDDSTLADDPWFEAALRSYFPRPVLDRFATALDRHPLRGPIIATVVANEIVNLGGITFVFRAMEETGASALDVVRASSAVIEIFGIRGLWDRIAHDPSLPMAAQDSLQRVVRRLLDRATRWFLQTRGDDVDIAAEVAHLRPVVRDHAPLIPDMLVGVERDRLERQVADLVALGAPQDLATEVATGLDIFALLDIADIARRTGGDPEELARLYFAVSERYDVDRTLTRITGLARHDRWSALARQALRSDLYQVIALLTEQMWRTTKPGLEPQARMADWETTHQAGLARARTTLDEISGAQDADLATLSVALRMLRNLVAQGRTSADR